MIPFGDWTPDLPDKGSHATIAKNVIPALVSYRSFPALSVFSNALDAACNGAMAFKPTGIPYNFAGTPTKLYLLSSATYSNVSRVLGYAGSNENRWRFTTYGNRVIATNLVDPPQSYIIGTSTIFADLTATLKARFVGNIREFTVFAYTNDATDGTKSNQVWWSAINNPTDYTPSVATQSDKQQIFGEGEQGEITGFVGGEDGTIFMEGGIHKMTYVGGDVIFTFNQIVFGAGCKASGSIAAFGSMIFYLGPDGFYALSGSQATPIGSNKIDKWFYSDLDQSLMHLISAVIDPINTLYIVAYPGTGNGGRCNRLIMFNWVTGKWSTAEPGDMETLVNTMSQAVNPDATDTDTIYGNPDTGPFANVSMDSRIFVGGKPQLSAINGDHKLAYFNAAPLTATIETAETQPMPGQRTLVTNCIPHIEGATNVSVEIGTRETVGGAVTYGSPAAINSNGECNLFANGRYMRARVTITGGFTHAAGIDFEASSAGRY